VVVVVSCRRVPPAADTTAVPVTRSDTTHQRLPEPYEYLGQVGVSLNSIDSIRARLPYDSIYLRREPCFGACPMYEATLYRDGSARYKGERFVERVGSYRGEVTIQDYGRMSYLLDKLEFMSLPDSFAVAATDLPGATMVVARRPQGVKAVHDYGYVGPVELWTLMEVFDGIVNRIQWQKSGP
jgi:hypothetical protein